MPTEPLAAPSGAFPAVPNVPEHPRNIGFFHRLTPLRTGLQRSVTMTLEQQFRSRVRAFLERSRLSPTRFGRMALGKPSLLRRIERGRSPTLRTADRILAFMAEYDRTSGGARDPPRRPRSRKPPPRPGRTKMTGATTDQPMNENTSPPTRILRLSEVQARTGLSRTTIYEWRLTARFPWAVPLGPRSVGWIESEIEKWIRERIADSRTTPVVPPADPKT